MGQSVRHNAVSCVEKDVSPEMPMNREFQKKVKDVEAEIGKLWKRRDASTHSY